MKLSRFPFAAALIIVAGSFSILAQIFLFPDPTEEAHWKSAADFVVERIERGDVIRVHPTWTESPFPFLTRVGNQLHRHHHPLIEDFQDVARVWIISETARTQDALARLPFDAASVHTENFETVTVLLVEVPESTQFSHELYNHIDRARVTRTMDGKIEHCSLWDSRAQQWHCGKRDRWLYVGQSLREISDDPRRCIMANPHQPPSVLHIEFPEFPLEHALRIRAGLDLRAARSIRGVDVDFRVFVDNELKLSHTIPADISEWQAHHIDTRALHGQTANVRMEVEAKSILDRFFCFNGWVLSE